MTRTRIGIASALTVSLVASVVAAGGASAQAPSCVSAAGRRVDLATPNFSRPSRITNPLFPADMVGQKIQLGLEAGETLRFETTPLPGTKVVRWNNQDVHTRAVQFVAYTADRVAETAIDFYAQDDSGNVWYFGEDVFNYEAGVIVNTDGTWLAGKDGPPGMIMPANPKVGDVYRPENIPGLVFEEVTVKATGKTVRGPKGRVRGAIFITECLADGVLENKTFAPGYGEFKFSVPTQDEVAYVALSVPTDALKAAAPRSLLALEDGAAGIFDAAPAGNWRGLRRTVRSIGRSWDTYRNGNHVPRRLKAKTTAALALMRRAVSARDAGALRQASIDLAQAALDIELRYRTQTEVDRDRIALWQRQLAHDAATGDPGDVAGDKAVIAAIKARLRP